MISKQFNNGNYNDFDNLVSVKLAQVNKSIKEEIIASLDKILVSMLGENSEIIKESINVKEVIENDSLTGIKCDLIYEIPDFKVPEAPEKAIEEDTEAIVSAINNKNLTNISIDVKEGKLTANLLYIL